MKRTNNTTATVNNAIVYHSINESNLATITPVPVPINKVIENPQSFIPETPTHDRDFSQSFVVIDNVETPSLRMQATVFYASGCYKGFAVKSVQTLLAPHMGKGGKWFYPSDKACKVLLQILEDGFTTKQEKECNEEYETSKGSKPVSLDDIAQESSLFAFEYIQSGANIYTDESLETRSFEKCNNDFVKALFHHLFHFINGSIKEHNNTKIESERAENEGFSVVDLIPFEVDRHFTFTLSMKEFFATLSKDERIYALRLYHGFTQTESAKGLKKTRTTYQRAIERKAIAYYERYQSKETRETVNHAFLSECLTYGINTAYNRHFANVSDRVENTKPVYSRETALIRAHKG